MEKRLLSKEEKLAIINEVEQSGNITQVIRKQYGFSVKLRMTKKREEWILDQVKDDKECFIPHYPFCHSRDLYVIPATSMSFPRKRESRIKRFWIPNQVGDDKLLDPR